MSKKIRALPLSTTVDELVIKQEQTAIRVNPAAARKNIVNNSNASPTQTEQAFDDLLHDQQTNSGLDTRRPDLWNGQILELYKNFLVLPDLRESARGLLRYVEKVNPLTERAALLIRYPDKSEFETVARLRLSLHEDITIKNDLVNMLQRGRQPLWLQSRQAPSGQVLQPVLLPLVHDTELIGVAYLELGSDDRRRAEMPISLAQSLLNLCGPVLKGRLLENALERWLNGALEAMVASIAAKDTYTVGHSERVCRYALAVADALRLDKATKKALRFSALVHDIGKIAIPDVVLRKAALLSTEEFDQMRKHPEIGANMIQGLPNAPQIMAGVRNHHERLDGTGYPDGLAGEAIPLFARIIAITDSFDAMTSGRSYSGYMSTDEACERLNDMHELFDPEVRAAFVRAYNSGAISIRTGTVNAQRRQPIDREKLKARLRE